MLDQARAVLAETFGHADFRPGQAQVIEHVLAGRDMLAVMPTGAGKSLCYQVPAIVRGGLTVVVSPLLALMDDQVSALKLAGVAAEAINSLHDRSTNIDSWRRVQAGEVRLLYLSPERLMDARMLSALGKLPLTLIAIDEAHCIAQWGPSFRPDYAALSQLQQHFPGVPILALTATADAVTREDILGALCGGRAESYVAGFDRPNIRLEVAAKDKPKDQLLGFLADHAGENGIIYCLSRKSTDATAKLLREAGHNAVAYHAGLETQERKARQDRFMTEGDLIMVATIAFGMGIDKPDIRFVFHADLPASLEAYYQEIGRAGRDGAPAVARMIYGLDDIRTRRRFIEEENLPEEGRRRAHRRLDALLAYAAAPECRRAMLLDYFGEGPEEGWRCGNCDPCLSPDATEDRTEEGRLVAETVRATGERFGAAHIAAVIGGGDTEKIRQFGHDRLPVHGRGSEQDTRFWRDLILQLCAARFMVVDVAGYGGLSLTQRGRALLAGKERFRARRSAPQPRAQKAAKAPPPELGEADAGLLARLKETRLELAREHGVPAYVIFHDSTLIDMAARKPQRREELLRVKGMGEHKLDLFGDRFLAVLASTD